MVGNSYSKMNAGTNSYAVASLTMGILSILAPFFGILFGFIGAVLSKKARMEMVFSGEDGRSLATAGSICSVIGICLQVLIMIGYFAFKSLGM